MIRIIAIALLAGLGACNSTRQAEEAALARDDRECRSYGVQPGSQAYVACRMNLKQTRTISDVANQQSNDRMAAVGLRMMGGY